MCKHAAPLAQLRDPQETVSRYLWAFNPFARIGSGRPASTPETDYLQSLRTWGDDPEAARNRKRIEDFIDRECQPHHK